MKHFAQMSIEKLPVAGRICISFVGAILPFVCIKKPVKIPFIRLNTPLGNFSGFTAVELMVALAIVAMLMVLAVPNMRSILQDTQSTTQANDLITDVSVARSEAIRRSTNVQICTWFSAGSPTTPTCNGGGDWSLGRVTWVDTNGNGVCDPTEVIRSHEAMTPRILAPTVAIDPIVFNSRGLPSAGSVTFKLCDGRGASHARFITISATGQTSTPITAVASCP